LREPAGADPVCALFVFLDLLERHADLPAKVALRQLFLNPANADVLTNQHIDR